MPRALSEIVLAEGLIDRPGVLAAERRAKKTALPLVVVLAERIGESAVLEALVHHLRVPLVDPRAEAPDPDALREVPHELACRRRLLPMSLEDGAEGPRLLRLAMADPTDGDAVAEVEVSTGCRVQPLLCSLTAVDEAVARCYRGIVTAVMRRDGERVPFGGNLHVATPGVHEGPHPSTEPHHRLEDEASLELRHRALIEALVKKGILSEEDYVQELRTLLKQRE